MSNKYAKIMAFCAAVVLAATAPLAETASVFALEDSQTSDSSQVNTTIKVKYTDPRTGKVTEIKPNSTIFLNVNKHTTEEVKKAIESCEETGKELAPEYIDLPNSTAQLTITSETGKYLPAVKDNNVTEDISSKTHGIEMIDSNGDILSENELSSGDTLTLRAKKRSDSGSQYKDTCQVTLTDGSGNPAMVFYVKYCVPCENIESKSESNGQSPDGYIAVTDHNYAVTISKFENKTLGMTPTDTINWYITDTQGNKIEDKEIANVEPNVNNDKKANLRFGNNGQYYVHADTIDLVTGNVNNSSTFFVTALKNNPAKHIDILNANTGEIVTNDTIGVGDEYKLGINAEGSNPNEAATDVFNWTSSDPKVATVDSHGVVSAKGKGTVTITASGDAEGVTSTVTFNVIAKANQIKFALKPEGNQEVGSTFTAINVRVKQDRDIIVVEDPNDANEEIEWSVDNPEILSITPADYNSKSNIQGANIKGLKEGTCKITARAKSSGQVGTLTVTVTKEMTITDLGIFNGDGVESNRRDEENPQTLYLHEPVVTLNAILKGKDTNGNEVVVTDQKVNWTVSDENLADCKIYGNTMTVQAVKKGEFTITATDPASGKSTTCKVINLIPSKSVTIKKEENDKLVDAKSCSLLKEESVQLYGVINKRDDEETHDDVIASWESDDPTVATVDQNGNVTGVSTGLANITVTTVYGHTATCQVKVYMVSNIKIDNNIEFLDQKKGSSTKLSATVTQGDDTTTKDVTWSSSNEDVATVDENGNVKFLSVGYATITASKGNESADVGVTVYENMSNISCAQIADIQYIPGSKPITPKPEVLDGGKALVENTDFKYSYTYSNNSTVPVAGSASVTLTGVEPLYRGSKTVTFKITQKPLADGDVVVSPMSDETFTGSAIKPKVEVIAGENGDVTLEEGVDYTISGYKDNTNVGTATVTITGKGNYSGTITQTFEIVPMDVSNLTFADINEQTYTGNELTPVTTITRNNDKKTLSSTDYDVSYRNNVNTGTAYVDYRMKGNYTGKKTISFKITPKAVTASGMSVDRIADVTFTGREIKAEPVVKDGTKVLEKDKDYTLSYENNVNVGTATCTITGTGNYQGTRKVQYKIVQADIANGIIADIPDQIDTQVASTPKPEVTYNGITLEQDKDYTVSYKNNLGQGTATVTITGKGNFKGTNSATFEIVYSGVDNPAEGIIITDEEGNVIGDDYTVYVDEKEEKTFNVKLSAQGECDDIVTLYDENKTKVATLTEITNNGLEGKFKVTGSSTPNKDDENYQITISTQSGQVSRVIKVHVYKPAQSLTIDSTTVPADETQKGVTTKDITRNRVTVIQNKKLQLSVNFNPSNSTDKIEWIVSDTNKAEINEDGLLTAKNSGSINVTARVKPTENSRRGLECSATITIKPANPVINMYLDTDSCTLQKDKKKTLVLTTVAKDNTNPVTDDFKWVSSDEKVATVSQDGVITAKSKGEADITVYCDDPAVTAKCHVVVETPATSIKLSESTKTILLSETKDIIISATQNNDANEKLVWKSSDEGIARVEPIEEDYGKNVQRAKIIPVGVYVSDEPSQCQITVSTDRQPAEGETSVTNVSATCTVTVTECQHNKTREVIIKNPTCTEEGLKNIVCADCGAVISGGLTVQKAEHHRELDEAVSKAPNCKEEGYNVYKCSQCGETKTETVNKTDEHNYDNGKITRKPTCTNTGIRTYTCVNCGKTITEEIEALGHKYKTEKVNATCTKTGYTQEKCTVCGAIRNKKIIPKSAHSYVVTVVKPTYTTKGYTLHKCKVCGYSYKDKFTNVLKKPVSISKAKVGGIKTSYVYSGKLIKPSVTLKVGSKTLKRNTDYTVTYKNNKNTGKAAVIIKGKGSYTGTLTKYFTIVPKKSVLTGISAKKGGKAVVNWKKDTQASGYELQYSTSSRFVSKKSESITKNSVTSKIITKLVKNKKYYVRVRAYKVVSGKKVYGSWSSVKAVRAK